MGIQISRSHRGQKYAVDSATLTIVVNEKADNGEGADVVHGNDSKNPYSVTKLSADHLAADVTGIQPFVGVS